MIGEAVDGAAGLEAALTLRPDFVLLDIGLPDIEGFEVARNLADRLRGSSLHRAATPERTAGA